MGYQKRWRVIAVDGHDGNIGGGCSVHTEVDGQEALLLQSRTKEAPEATAVGEKGDVLAHLSNFKK